MEEWMEAVEEAAAAEVEDDGGEDELEVEASVDDGGEEAVEAVDEGAAEDGAEEAETASEWSG